MEQKRAELLQSMAVFGGVERKTLEFITARACLRKIGQGDYFFHQGDRADSMFVLEKGEVSVIKTDQGRSRHIRTLKQGDCFGEMALLDLYPRSSSIVAMNDCTAIEIAQTVLFELYQHDIEAFAMIQMNIGREISRRLRLSDEQLFQKIRD